MVRLPTGREVIGKVCRIRFHYGRARDTPVLGALAPGALDVNNNDVSVLAG